MIQIASDRLESRRCFSFLFKNIIIQRVHNRPSHRLLSIHYCWRRRHKGFRRCSLRTFGTAALGHDKSDFHETSGGQVWEHPSLLKTSLLHSVSSWLTRYQFWKWCGPRWNEKLWLKCPIKIFWNIKKYVRPLAKRRRMLGTYCLWVGKIFIVLHLVWHGTSVLRCHPKVLTTLFGF